MTETELRENSIRCRYCIFCYENIDNFFCSNQENAEIDGTYEIIELDHRCSRFVPREKVEEERKFEKLEKAGQSYEANIGMLAFTLFQKELETAKKRADGSYVLELANVPSLYQKLKDIDEQKDRQRKKQRLVDMFKKIMGLN